MRVLVTGGAGYIGSHTVLELMAAGHDVQVLDNFENASPEVLVRLRELSNGELSHVEADIRDSDRLAQVMQDFRPEAVVHFAGLKSVPESGTNPLRYYDVNVTGTLRLVKAMEAVGCGRIIFSSSATVYGAPQYLPYDEKHPCAPVNVYGRTKLMAEQALTDWQATQPGSSVVLLRYFNPVGAHASAQIGEDPRGVPGNLMPFVAQVAVGRRETLQVFGDDYDTPDGTGVRDYIHVVDLARAHLAALDAASGASVYNVGTGTGYSVMDMVKGFEAASGRPIPLEISARRPGDLPAYYADSSRAQAELNWRAEHTLDDICASTWRWQSQNPNGY